MRMHKIIAVAVLALLAAVSAAQDYGTRNPAAPPEVDQFAFLVGRWHCDFTGNRADGSVMKGTADWRIRWIIDGHALQDEWTFADENGTVLNHGTMFRTWDAGKGHWTIVEQGSTSPRFHFMTAEKVGETMVMHEEIETAGGKIKARRVFHDITPDSFQWRVDISRDGGTTWQEGVQRMSCRRVE
jgi:hypothetical protein